MLVLACLLAGAMLLRVDGIGQPSVSTREMHNALLAREYYYGAGAGLPAWQQRVLFELRRSVQPVEPPVLDHFAALEYRIVGGEHLWAPRLISALFWVLGGVFLYRIALRVTSGAGALVAVALYLFWPYGVVMSRLYFPDPMMIALILAGALTVIRYWELESRGRLAAASGVAALATAAKPGIALVFLAVLFAAIAASRRALRHALLRGRLPLFVAVAAAPTLAYFVYGSYIRHFLESEGNAGGRVQPHLVATAHFWRGWWTQVSTVVVFPQHQRAVAVVALVAAGAGLIAIRSAHGRAIVGGLLVGYVAYAFVFAGFTADNAYYALPLVPALALAVGALVGFGIDRGSAVRRGRFGIVVVAVLAIVVLGGYKSLPTAANRTAIADYRRIGELTRHTTRAIIVDQRLRAPAMYWGWIVGSYWYEPTPGQDLPGSGNPFPPGLHAAEAAYLVVVDMAELRSEPRLRMLTRRLPIVGRTSGFAVFDLRGGRALPAARSTRG